MNKQCTKCKEVKPITEFTKHKTRPDGHHSHCKQCNKEYRKANKERIKAKRDTNKESMKDYCISYYQQNVERLKKRRIERYKANKEAERQYRYENKPPNQQWRYIAEAYRWKRAIYKRDNLTCQHCGKTHCTINAHHIKSAKDYPDLRYDINNGICLCEQCHKQVHYNI